MSVLSLLIILFGFRCFNDESGVSEDRSAVPLVSLREHESEPITFPTLGLETRIFGVLPLPSPKHLLLVKADDWPNKGWKQR